MRLDVHASRARAKLVGLAYRGASPNTRNLHRGAQGTILLGPEARDVGNFLPFWLVAFVYVPRVPLARLVRVCPKLIAAPVQNLAIGGPVVDAAETAVGTDLNLQQVVLEESALAQAPGPNFGSGLRGA